MSLYTAIPLVLASLSTPDPTSPSTPARTPSADDLHAYAIVLAVAKTAADRCNGVTMDLRLIKAIYEHIGFDDRRDGARLAANGREIAAAMNQEIAHAPSLHSWCDGIFARFGPDGTVLRGLIQR